MQHSSCSHSLFNIDYHRYVPAEFATALQGYMSKPFGCFIQFLFLKRKVCVLNHSPSPVLRTFAHLSAVLTTRASSRLDQGLSLRLSPLAEQPGGLSKKPQKNTYKKKKPELIQQSNLSFQTLLARNIHRILPARTGNTEILCRNTDRLNQFFC